MTTSQPLAIVGMACRLPGGIRTPQEYWDFMMADGNGLIPVPDQRWRRDKFAGDAGVAGVGRVRGGGFLTGTDMTAFDFGFFGISAREAEYMDPQQRLLLEVAWEAIEHAGCGRRGRPGAETGVFVGGFTADYGQLQFAGGRAGREKVSSYTSTGMVMTMLSNRISYALDLTGPSMTIDTACSSSLTALDAAAAAIHSGQCDSALVGGVNLMLAPNFTIAASHGGFLSPTSESHPFDVRANGYVRAEGAAMVVLKPLAEARAEGLPIRAVLLATAVNQDGRTTGITIPSGDRQAELMRRTIQQAGIDARAVQYVEAHGTGTPVGDPIETEAIGQVYGAGSGREHPVIVTSVKGNLGHMEAAAGVTGLIRAVLCLEHGIVPAQHDLQEINPAIHCEQWGIDIPREHRVLPDVVDAPRLAAVNSFGFGGANAHAVLASAPTVQPVSIEPVPHCARPVVVVSARSEGSLAKAAEHRAGLLESGMSTEQVAALTWMQDARHASHRLAVYGDDAAAITAALRGIDTDGATRVTGSAEGRTSGDLCFVYTGMGPQWWGMARQLIETEQAFVDTLREIDHTLEPLTGWSVIDELLRPETDSRMDRTAISQPANFAIQVGITTLLRSWGIVPDAVVGHSAGEPAAAWAAGALSLTDATRVIAHRARLQDRTAGQGRLAAVGLSRDAVLELPWLASGKLELAAENDANSVAVVGEEQLLDELAEALTPADIFVRKIPGNVPYHSSHMDPLHPDVLVDLAGICPKTPVIPLYSTVTGTRLEGRCHDVGYWWQNIRQSVEFRSATDALVAAGARTFVEIGPAPTLRRSIQAALEAAGENGEVLATLDRNLPDSVSLARTAAQLFAHGQDVDLTGQWAPPPGITLPTYPWDRTAGLWVESESSRIDRTGDEVDVLLGHRASGPGFAWWRTLDRSLPAHLLDHRVGSVPLTPGAMWVSMMQAAAKDAYGVERCSIEDLVFHHGLPLDLNAGIELATRLEEKSGEVQIHGQRGLDQPWQLLASGMIRPLGVPTTATPPAIEGRLLDGAEAYAVFAELGFHYGPAFQLIREARVAGERVLVSVDASTILDRSATGMITDPALVDAAFQLLLTLADQWNPDREPMLPVGVAGVRVAEAWHPGAGNLTGWAEPTFSDENEIAADAWLRAPDGTIVVEVRGFRVRRVRTASPRLGSDWLHQVEWSPDVAHERVVARSELLVLAHDAPWVDRLVEGVRAAGRPCEHVTPAALANRILDGPEGGIVDLRALDAEDCERPDISAAALTAQVLDLARALLQREVNLTLTVVTRGGVPRPDVPMTRVGLAQSGLWGLVRTLHQESATLDTRLVDLDCMSDERVDALALELATPDEEDQVLLGTNGRQVARLQPTGQLASVPAHISADSTCLITGGLGALGTIFARWLADRGARHIVLGSRTAAPDEQQWGSLPGPRGEALRQVAELRAAGIDVEVRPLDAADEASVRALVAELAATGRPPIRTVLHVAGAVRDRQVVEMSDSDLTEVLTPKMTGAWTLHSVLGAELQHLVLFSSVSSVVVTAGQGNYAAANAFMDALAHYRRANGKTAQSWNWGPWDAGMIAALGLEESFARRGIDLINPEDGTRLATVLLGSDAVQQVIVSADWSKVVAAYAIVPRLVLHLAEDPTEDSGADGVTTLDRVLAVTGARRLEVIREECTNVVSMVLRTPPERLVRTRPLNQMGLDSMIGVEFRVRLEKAFGVAPSLVSLLQQASIDSIADEIAACLDEADDVDALADLAAGLDGSELASLLAQVEATE